jgi:multidrug efflux pump subunit AcrB
MRGLIRYFIKYPINGDMLMIALLISGILGMTNLKSTFFPETASKIIAIQVVYPGASPEEIEEGIVAKIEDNLKGIAGVDQVKSVCSENSGSITVEVLDEDQTDEILQDVKNAVDRISSFPLGMEPPVIFKQDAINFAISFAVNGDLDLATLKRYAKDIETDVRSIPGISQVELSGYPAEEIEVRLKEDRLLALNITVAEIAGAIRAANIETTGGKIKTEREELLIRGRYKEYRAKELRDLVVRATPDGKVIRLGDLAEVTDQWSEDNPSRSWFNGAPAVVVTVNNLLSEDMLDITEHVRTYIELYNQQNMEVRLDVIRDGSITLSQRIDLLVSNGIFGFLLVVLFLALFLNYRLAFWVALAIPVSFAGMFVLASMIGITINVVSLFGMILVIGILVDDGIVIAENIYQHYELGESRIDATINGTMEVLPAVFSAIVTTIIAFSSFYFIEGRLGDIFAEMATVVILTLVFSLVEGAFILPAHVGHSKALSRTAKPNGIERGLQNFMNWMRNRIYAPVLRFSMKNGWITASIIIGIFLITVPGLIGGGFVKTTFFPFIEGDNITINLKMAAGTREHLTKEALDKIEVAIWEVNKELSAEREDTLQIVQAIDKNLGPTTYDGSMRVQLLDGERRNVRVMQVTQLIREKTGVIYGAENLSFGAFSPFGRPVSVSLLSNNLDELSAAAADLRTELEKRNDLRDVTDNNQKGLKEVNVKLKPKAYHLGLTEQEVLSQLRQGFFGNEVQRLQRGEDEVRVWVRLDESDRSSVAQLEKIRIRTATGLEVPLTELAELNVERGIVAINRMYGQREVQVSADIANSTVSATDAIADIKENVIPVILAGYPEVRVSYEGQNRETAKSQKSIQTVMPLIFLLMLFVIILTFRSPLQGLAVFLLIPFGLIGVSLGHWVLGAQISLFSILGMIALIGILVNDSLVLVAAYNINLKKGINWRESIFQAGMSRFRPILLTSVTTIAGLAPLILNKSFQAQFLIPMAISVAFGLLFTTVIILVLLPVFLVWINPLHRTWVWLRNGKIPPEQDAEPAIRELQSIERFEKQE